MLTGLISLLPGLALLVLSQLFEAMRPDSDGLRHQKGIAAAAID
jgi:hypothetical protein